ncbi:MAG: chemotaxis-specific protein-glutamate methyltransferase CheB [Alphaproteobacteria bacterium]|jgi:two-component system, chemotaxis family, protein-glutamate methylesterase/glutaminase|nr:chemotaxis-specific protein-glutamate methyltransferase CheB [Alphaproteobacteria bacterium]MBT7941784.1 chemotaxis-specific protein-glutamate methyltransferase CheB [Alphaproteobacteria bacterium]
MASSPSKPNAAVAPVQAMVIGDSQVVGDMVDGILGRDARIQVAARPADGEKAVVQFRTTEAEVVVIDIGGNPKQSLTTISRLLRIDAKVRIIMVSTLSFTNVKTGLEGIERGAVEFLQTPATHTKDSSHAVFQHNLTETVFELGMARREEGERLAKKPPSLAKDAPITLRPASTEPPKVLVIASSTGGPQALLSVFAGLSASFTLPVLIAQHMPPVFTGALAQNIARTSGRPCVEGKDGEVLKPGHVYVAPGDYHMVLERNGSDVCIGLNQDARENYCRPSAEPLFRSAAKTFGPATLGLVLTGMGSDGAAGAQTITRAGGTIIAQDHETSVVWGMPGAVAGEGLCSAVLALGEIGGYLNEAASYKP